MADLAQGPGILGRAGASGCARERATVPLPCVRRGLAFARAQVCDVEARGQEVAPADAERITCTALRIGTRTDSHARHRGAAYPLSTQAGNWAV